MVLWNPSAGLEWHCSVLGTLLFFGMGKVPSSIITGLRGGCEPSCCMQWCYFLSCGAWRPPSTRRSVLLQCVSELRPGISHRMQTQPTLASSLGSRRASLRYWRPGARSHKRTSVRYDCVSGAMRVVRPPARSQERSHDARAGCERSAKLCITSAFLPGMRGSPQSSRVVQPMAWVSAVATNVRVFCYGVRRHAPGLTSHLSLLTAPWWL